MLSQFRNSPCRWTLASTPDDALADKRDVEVGSRLGVSGMKVVLVFIEGPADGNREEMEVNSPVPFRYRTKTRVGDRQVPGTNQANDAVYLFARSRSTPGARRGVRSNDTTAIIICPCGKVNHPARISKLVMNIL